METTEHITLRNPTSFEELKSIEEWLLPDEEGQRWLASYLDVQALFRLLSDTRKILFLEYRDTNIGFVALEIAEGGKVVHFSLYLSPEWRGKGFGRLSLLSLQDYCQQLGASQIKGGIEQDNQRSRACALSAGMSLVYPQSPDDDLIVASMVLKKAAT